VGPRRDRADAGGCGGASGPALRLRGEHGEGGGLRPGHRGTDRPLMQPVILIIGSGMGGATLAAALAPSGRRIVILERGERLADCPEARDPSAIFRRGFFKPKEVWKDAQGRS